MTKALDLSQLASDPKPISVGEEAAENYAVVRQTLKRITEDWRDQPTLELLAKEAGLQPIQLQRVFARWAGLTPKQFLQAITLDHAKALLRDTASVLDASYEVGLSGSSRLHDLFVTHEAMTPGDYRNRGAGLKIAYGFHPSPFGQVLIMATDKGPGRSRLCGSRGRGQRAQRYVRALAGGKLLQRSARNGQICRPGV